MLDTVVAIGRLVAGVAGLGLLVLGYRVWRRHERSTGQTFAELLAVVGVAGLCSSLLPHSTIVYKLIWLYAFLGIPVVFARFSFDYYGLEYPSPRFAWATLPAVVAGIAGTLLLLVDPSFAPGVMGRVTLPEAGLELARAVRDVGMYYSSGLMLVALGLVIRSVLHYEHLEQGLGVSLAFVGGWAWIAYVISPELVGTIGRRGTLLVIAGCYGTSLAAGLLAYRRYDVLDAAPAASNAAPERVLDAIEDAVVVVTEDHRILRLNDAATEQFGIAEPEAVGGSAETILGITPADLAADCPVDLQTATGGRRFELEPSEIADRAGNLEGRAIVCRDVTERETREQRLEVLNRVMRHNLRNDLSKILGHADLITDGGQAAVADHASTIKGTAEDLASIGERAREVEQLMGLPARAGTPTDVGAVIAAVTAELRDEYPAVEISTAAAGSLTSPVNDRILRIVLRNLVDNACVHNDADEPLVVVSAEADASGGLAIAIADNGPGLEAHEREPLNAGREQPLEHGSGLGLWTAQWGVTRLGGELSFSDNEPRGTIVRLDLPVV